MQIRDFSLQVKKEVLKEWMHGWNWINLISWMLGTYQKRNVFQRTSKSWKIDPFTWTVFEIRIYLLQKTGFFSTSINFSRLWLSHWLWNLNILKIHSIYDLTVYKMSIFGKDWSVQIFFTKNVHCPMGRSSFFEPCRIFAQVNWKSELFLGIGSTKFN